MYARSLTLAALDIFYPSLIITLGNRETLKFFRKKMKVYFGYISEFDEITTVSGSINARQSLNESIYIIFTLWTKICVHLRNLRKNLFRKNWKSTLHAFYWGLTKPSDRYRME